MAAAALTHAAWEPSVGFKPQFTPEGEPDYSHWINSVHWSSRRMLLSREGTASSLYSGTGRVYLPSADGTRNMPRDVYPYTLRIADRDLPTIEGQLALLWHVILYEDRTGRTILSSSQRWDFYFVTTLLGCLSVEELYKFTLTTQQVTREQNTPYSSTVSASKAFSAVFRHEAVHRNDLDEMNSLPIGSCNTRRVIPRQTNAVWFAAFMLTNSKGRFFTYVRPAPCSPTGEVGVQDFAMNIRLGAIQGHTRVSSVQTEEALGMEITLGMAGRLGYVFHATEKWNHDNILKQGLITDAGRPGEKRDPRCAVHFTYAGGEEAPRAGTVIRYGSNVIYVVLDLYQAISDGCKFYLSDNGVILSFQSVPPSYLHFTWRPPHEKDPGGRRWEKREGRSAQAEEPSAPSSSSRGPASSSAGTKGSSASAEGSKGSGTTTKEAGPPSTGPTTVGEVPHFDLTSLREIIEEEEKRHVQQSETSSEGKRIPFERGMEVEGSVKTSLTAEAEKVRAQEDLIRQLRANPWTLFYKGTIALMEDNERKVDSYGTGYVQALWLHNPLSGYPVLFFLEAFRLGKIAANVLIDFQLKVSHYDHHTPHWDADYFTELRSKAESVFTPGILYGRAKPEVTDERNRMPVEGTENYAEKLAEYQAFRHELMVAQELINIQSDFVNLYDMFVELYGSDFFLYMKENRDNQALRNKFVVRAQDNSEHRDCSLRLPFEPKLILKKIERTVASYPERKFLSRFASKAVQDLQQYVQIRQSEEAFVDYYLGIPVEDFELERTFENNEGTIKIEEVIEVDESWGSSTRVEEPKVAPSSLDATMEEEAGSATAEGPPPSSEAHIKEEPMPDATEEVKEPDPEVQLKVEEGDFKVEEESSTPMVTTGETEGSSLPSEAPSGTPQGLWGNVQTVITPQDLQEITQQNEDALRSFADKKEEATLEQLPEYQRFIDELERVEKGSPIYILSRQKYGESDGILHGGLRAQSAQNRFRLQHMSWRDRAAPARSNWKFQVPEVPFFETMATMPPLWEFRPAAKQVAFKSIDVRSTFSTDALERSYNAHVAIAEKEALLMESLAKTNATRGDLLNTLLRHFLACGSLETTSLGSSAFAEEPDPMAEMTHLATSRVGLSVMVANLGNFARGRKGTLPPKYADLISDYSDGSSIIVKFLSHSKAHVILLQENNMTREELDYFRSKGWLFRTNEAGDLLTAVRGNTKGKNKVSFKHLAGPVLKDPAYAWIPIRYEIVQINYGSTVPRERMEQEDLVDRVESAFEEAEFKEDLTRAGMKSIRVCNFHVRSEIARSKPGFLAEGLAAMVADCFHYQVDLMGGDGNMSCYRFGGSQQGSVSHDSSALFSTIQYFVGAFEKHQRQDRLLIPRTRVVTSNPLHLLKLYEEKLGFPYGDVGHLVDWTTFPDLDCMTAIVFEWGHSMTNEVWAEYKGSMEYKVSVSEFLLHSTKNHFLLKPSDNDSHTPLLLHIAPNWMKFSEKKTYRSKESILQASQSRKERQKAKKRGAPAEPVQGEGRAPPGKGKSKSKEGGSLPSEEPSAVPEPAAPPKAKPAAKPAAARPEKGKARQEARDPLKVKFYFNASYDYILIGAAVIQLVL
ncbi:unnamed protein product [Symbiodinium natans]|uniref:Uncharacterized protein n=1 Tax=Symbiodinium natans TaxID=878477 RepID=A0A812S7C9_9DINO|nr:unnamed protein product [Symbiodinium natans]